MPTPRSGGGRRLAVVLEEALGVGLVAAGLCDDAIALEDDLTRGPLFRTRDDDAWARARSEALPEGPHSDPPPSAAALRLALARLRTASLAEEVVVFGRATPAARLALGLAATRLLFAPPAEERLRYLEVPRPATPGALQEAIAARRPLSHAELADLALAFDREAARREGERRAPGLEVPLTIETERLVLRAPRLGDGAELFQAVRESDARLRPYMDWVDEHPDASATEHGVREAHLAFLAREDLRYHGYRKDDGALVLATGFHRPAWPPVGRRGGRAEIGYWVREGAEGKGYVSEAVRALIRTAEGPMGLDRLEIRCDAGNERSRRIPERLGFRLAATLERDGFLPGGAPKTTLIYERLAGA